MDVDATRKETLKIDPLLKNRCISNRTVVCAPDKSLTHRALIFSAIAEGTSRIIYPLLGADCRSTIGCFEALGVDFFISESHEGPVVEVKSKGIHGFQRPTRPLDCGNSGTTTRLLLGLLASIPALEVELIGDASLSSRPMRRVVAPLRSIGASIVGEDNGNRLPIKIFGCQLNPGEHLIDKATAQVKSGLILAGLNISGKTIVRLPNGSRDHTEKMLQKMGADLAISVENEQERIELNGPFQITPSEYKIPVDPSSAAFLSVLGLLLPHGSLRLKRVLDNPTRLGFLNVLRRMSNRIVMSEEDSQEEGFVERLMEFTVHAGGTLQATDIEPTEIPTLIDEIPILAVAASFARGVSRFKGLSELRVKESDRLQTTLALLTAAGIKAAIINDDLVIKGGGEKVDAFHFDSCGDHRLAMSAAILAKKASSTCSIVDYHCVDVSFPGFFDLLEAVC